MRVFLSLLLVAILSGIAQVRTEGFSQEAIASALEGGEGPSFELGSQHYRYLASGRQAYVFVSEDGKTVLKFFRKGYYSLPWYFSFLPPSLKRKEITKRKKRESFYRKSYKIAAEQFKEETGILFAHFGPSKELPQIELIDKAHRLHKIDLNGVSFVLQRRAEPLYPFLLARREAIEPAIELFLSQIARRIALGIADGDQDVGNNFGWLDGELLHLDPGRLSYDQALQDPSRKKHEWWRGTHRFRKWLIINAPEAIHFFDDRFEKFHK